MPTKRPFFKISLIIIVLLSAFNSNAQDLKSEIDNYIQEFYSSDSPGLSILVAKNGKSIYSNGFGMASLELGVPSVKDNVYEIGSITKQFTAVSILMLEEQGKLSVDDEITKFIPDYPTAGEKITVHHLLNHTSGIKSYTNMPSFKEQAREDKTVLELIDVFKNEEMEFKPGDDFNYNNSGYILLGYIIEVASGMTYEDFIEQQIFEVLGMNNSYYGSNIEIIPNRAIGYSQTENGFRNADYLSKSLPYAAGSIMSTVEDLLIWQNAIRDNKLIKKSSLDKAINGSTLNDGENIPYGYGWGKADIQGSRTYEHSGGIFGYTSNGIYLVEEDVYVVGLTNCNCGDVSGITKNIAAMAIGKPFPKLEDAVTLTDKQKSKWVGAYEFEEGVIRYITLKDSQLFSMREGSQNMTIYPLSENDYFFEDGTITYEFYKKDGKKMAKFIGYGDEFIGEEIDKAPPAEKASIDLDPKILKTYIGKYELAPEFYLSIDMREDKLYGLATGQAEVELFATEKDEFFLKVVPAEISFIRSDKGEVVSLILHQGGADVPGKKIE